MDLEGQHITICKYFTIIMVQFYNKIDIEAEREYQHEIRLTLLNYETNIWSALDRIKDFNEKKQKSKEGGKSENKNLEVPKDQK